jgi:pimeloyl-ACP methyl ester carboxylesterase
MRRAAHLGPFRAVDLPQGTIRYRELGSGEPVVFVHGLLVNGDLWRKVVPPLSRHCRCIVPDLPLGSHEIALKEDADLSPSGLAQLLSDFLAALDLERTTLVANDAGGALTQIVMTESAERIGRVVLTDCDSYDAFPPRFFRPLHWGAHVPGFLFLIGQLLQLRWFQRLPIAYGWLAKYSVAPETLASYVGSIATSAAIRRDLGKVLKGTSARYTLQAARKFPQFDKPVLVAWARQDRFFPLRYAHAHHKAFPNARLELIEDCYTFVPEDQPERLAALIEEFLTQNDLEMLSGGARQ